MHAVTTFTHTEKLKLLVHQPPHPLLIRTHMGADSPDTRKNRRNAHGNGDLPKIPFPARSARERVPGPRRPLQDAHERARAHRTHPSRPHEARAQPSFSPCLHSPGRITPFAHSTHTAPPMRTPRPFAHPLHPHPSHHPTHPAHPRPAPPPTSPPHHSTTHTRSTHSPTSTNSPALHPAARP